MSEVETKKCCGHKTFNDGPSFLKEATLIVSQTQYITPGNRMIVAHVTSDGKAHILPVVAMQVEGTTLTPVYFDEDAQHTRSVSELPVDSYKVIACHWDASEDQQRAAVWINQMAQPLIKLQLDRQEAKRVSAIKSIFDAVFKTHSYSITDEQLMEAVNALAPEAQLPEVKAELVKYMQSKLDEATK